MVIFWFLLKLMIEVDVSTTTLQGELIYLQLHIRVI